MWFLSSLIGQVALIHELEFPEWQRNKAPSDFLSLVVVKPFKPTLLVRVIQNGVANILMG